MKQDISIYIHWPFCLSLCPYCDFNSHVMSEAPEESWINSYKTELSYFLDKLSNRHVKSVFFGGGTPSLMSPRIIAEVLDHISSFSDISQAEITLEANPTSSEAEKFKAFKQAGINRLSIGIQALNDPDLLALGRQHSHLEAMRTIEMASNIFSNYSFDLIYGRPNQTLEAWELELQKALGFGASHMSLYMLTIEKGTPFFKLYRDGKLAMPSADLSADLLQATTKIMSANNFERYEISNYSRPGLESRHNLGYWNYQDYIGVGPGAHSRVKDSAGNTCAIMMHHKPAKWLNEVMLNGHGIQKNEIITQDDKINEIVMMGLRIKSGLSEVSLIDKTGKNFTEIFDMEFLHQLQNEGLATWNKEEGVISLTDKGMNLHSYIMARALRG